MYLRVLQPFSDLLQSGIGQSHFSRSSRITAVSALGSRELLQKLIAGFRSTETGLASWSLQPSDVVVGC